MRSYLLILLVLFSPVVFSQSNNVSAIFIRHDTIILKAGECQWIVKSPAGNDPSFTGGTGKTVPEILLQAIAEEKLSAFDKETHQQIPAKQIYTWRMPEDTVQLLNDEGANTKYIVVQQRHNPDDLDQLRICQDWWLDISTGRLQPVIKWIEIMKEIHSSYSGTFIGHMTFCRIYY